MTQEKTLYIWTAYSSHGRREYATAESLEAAILAATQFITDHYLNGYGTYTVKYQGQVIRRGEQGMSDKAMFREVRAIRDRIERIVRVARNNPQWVERLTLHLHYRIDSNSNYAGVEITVSPHVRVDHNGNVVGTWGNRQKVLPLSELTKKDIYDWGETMFDLQPCKNQWAVTELHQRDYLAKQHH